MEEDKITCPGEAGEVQKEAYRIRKMYSDRKNRQKEISKTEKIPIPKLRKILADGNFEYGKKKSIENPNNLNPGQKLNAVTFFDEPHYDPIREKISERKNSENEN